MKRVSFVLIRVVTATLVVVGTLSVFNRLASETSIKAQSAEDRSLIVGPDHWVEFAATYVRSEQGRPPIVGRLFRGPDGSERLESGPSLDEPIGITLKNMPTNTYYVRDPRLGWQGHPMDQTDGPTRAARKSLFSNTATPLKYGDLEAFEIVTRRSGAVVRQVPALNFFTIDARPVRRSYAFWRRLHRHAVRVHTHFAGSACGSVRELTFLI